MRMLPCHRRKGDHEEYTSLMPNNHAFLGLEKNLNPANIKKADKFDDFMKQQFPNQSKQHEMCAPVLARQIGLPFHQKL
jgi:hypothetical protein